MSDIRPSEAPATEARKIQPEHPESTITKTVRHSDIHKLRREPVAKKPAHNRSHEHSEDPLNEPLGVGEAFQAAFSNLNQRKLITFGILAATLSTIPGAFATQSELLLSNDTLSLREVLNFLALNPAYATVFLSILASVLLVCYVLRRYAGGALIYGTAKLHDRRGGGALYWSYAGWNSVLTLIALDIIALSSILFSAAIVTTAMIAFYSLGLPVLAQALAFGVLGTTLGFIILGTLWARYLGQYTVLLAGFSSFEATLYGWRQFRRHFIQFWGAALVAILLNGFFLALHTLTTWLIAISAYNFKTDSSGIAVAMLTGWVFGTAILGSLSIANAVFGYHIYRNTALHLKNAHTMLAGRHVHKPHRMSTVMAIGALFTVTAVAASVAFYQQDLVIMTIDVLFASS